MKEDLLWGSSFHCLLLTFFLRRVACWGGESMHERLLALTPLSLQVYQRMLHLFIFVFCVISSTFISEMTQVPKNVYFCCYISLMKCFVLLTYYFLRDMISTNVILIWRCFVFSRGVCACCVCPLLPNTYRRTKRPGTGRKTADTRK